VLFASAQQQQGGQGRQRQEQAPSEAAAQKDDRRRGRRRLVFFFFDGPAAASISAAIRRISCRISDLRRQLRVSVRTALDELVPPSWRFLRRRFRRPTELAAAEEFRVRVVDDFLSAEEARRLLERYRPLLRTSRHAATSSTSTSSTQQQQQQQQHQQQQQSRYRTSRSARLPPLGDPSVFELERRAAQLAGSYPHRRVEDFQLACYSRGELYGLHRDDSNNDSDDSDDRRSANRVATVLIYLRDPAVGEEAGAGGSGKGGGATLFTNRALEDERELGSSPRSNYKLRTERAALELFADYCRRPRRHHSVVQPQVGRAATWKNWYEVVQDRDGTTSTTTSNSTNTTGATKTNTKLVFADESTHGACPVLPGASAEKCVVQQWITKTDRHVQPLRDTAKLMAIFPLGADVSFRQKLRSDSNDESSCAKDFSTNQGRYVSELCWNKEGGDSGDSDNDNADNDNSDGQTTAIEYLEDVMRGPVDGVGGIRILGTGGGIFGRILLLPPPESVQNNDEGLTVSFFAKNVRHGTELVALQRRQSQRTLVAVRAVLIPEKSMLRFELVRGDSYDDDDGRNDGDDGDNEQHGSSSSPPCGKKSNLDLRYDSPDELTDEWIWFVLTVPPAADTTDTDATDPTDTGAAGAGVAELRAYASRGGELLGSASIALVEGSDGDSATAAQDSSSTTTEPAIGISFGKNDEQSVGAAAATAAAMDMSFLLVHRGNLPPDESKLLRHQAGRYNVLT